MSRLEDLIAEHCPDGVAYFSLGDVTKNFDRQRKPVTKSNRLAGIFPYYGANGIQDYVQDYIFDGTFLLMGEDGSVKNNDGTPVLNWAEGKIWVNNHAHILQSSNEELDLRYLYYYLQTVDISSFVTGGTQPKINQKNMNSIPVAVPPLEVQREIVRILDTFSKMEAELEAELEARKQQYKYYRSILVTNSQVGDRLSLGDIEKRGLVKLGRGKVISKIDLEEMPGNYPVYSSSGAGTGEFGRYGDYMFDDERITWSVDGGGRFFYRHPHKFSVTNVSGWMTVDTSVLNVKYLYYVLTTQWEKQTFDYTRKAHPSVIRDVYSVSLPTLSEQEQVVQALDNFEALENDLSVGLPAELVARRQQYEYYRDKLLTFKELESAS